MADFEGGPKRHPFKQELIESDVSKIHKGSGKLLELESIKDKIVRVEHFSDLYRRFREVIDPITAARIGTDLYQELNQDYGINVSVQYVVGKGPQGDDVVYGITDKITGVDIDKIEVTPETTEAAAALYAKIADYYLQHLHQDGPYLADINTADQYVYGKRSGDSTPHVYLVDTDLYFRDGKVALYNIVLWFTRHLLHVEKKFGRHFAEARATIAKTLESPLPETLTAGQRVTVEATARKIRDYLADKKTSGKDPHPLFSNL